MKPITATEILANEQRILRWTRRPAFSQNGMQVLGYGFRFGYWPCYKAPFIEVALHKSRYQLWWGPVIVVDQQRVAL